MKNGYRLLVVAALFLSLSCQPVDQPIAGAVEIISLFPSGVYVNSPVIAVRMQCSRFPDDAGVTVNGVAVPVTAVYTGNQVWFRLPSLAVGTPSPLRVGVVSKEGAVLASHEMTVHGDALPLAYLSAGAHPSMALARVPQAEQGYDVKMVAGSDGTPLFHLLVYGVLPGEVDAENPTRVLNYVCSEGQDAFSAPLPVLTGGSTLSSASLALCESNVLIAAWTIRTETGSDIQFCRSFSRGEFWTNPSSFNPPGIISSSQQFICTRDNHLILAASSAAMGAPPIAYAVISGDIGERWHWAAMDYLTWHHQFTLVEGLDGTLFSSLYTQDQRVVVKRSRDGGINWHNQFITEDTYFSWPGPPPTRLFAGSADRLYLSLGTSMKDHAMPIGIIRAYVSISEDGGQSWGSRMRLDEQVYGLDSFSHQVLDDGSSLYILGQNREFVTLSRSRDQGRTWSPPQFVAAPKALAGQDVWVQSPRAFIHDGQIYVFWRENDGVHHARLRLNS